MIAGVSEEGTDLEKIDRDDCGDDGGDEKRPQPDRDPLAVLVLHGNVVAEIDEVVERQKTKHIAGEAEVIVSIKRCCNRVDGE